MNCPSCNIEVSAIGKTTQHYKLIDDKLNSHKYNIPFYCTMCGAIKFPYRAIRAIVFVWPLYEHATEYFNDNESLILIPEVLKQDELSEYGIILSYGPGVYNMKKSKWMFVTGLKVGMKVAYDNSVPWEIDIIGTDDKWHNVKICDFTDIAAEVIENE